MSYFQFGSFESGFALGAWCGAQLLRERNYCNELQLLCGAQLLRERNYFTCEITAEGNYCQRKLLQWAFQMKLISNTGEVYFSFLNDSGIYFVSLYNKLGLIDSQMIVIEKND